jgi:hypothetical protein
MVIFQFLTAANMKMDVFWGNLPCSLVEIDWRFKGASAHKMDKVYLSETLVRVCTAS